MKAPNKSGINKDFTEKSTDWIAADGKRCTDDYNCPVLLVTSPEELMATSYGVVGVVRGLTHM